MSVFKVTVSQAIVEECTVYVEAENEEQAIVEGEKISLKVIDWEYCETVDREVIRCEPAPGHEVWPKPEWLAIEREPRTGAGSLD